MRRTRTQRQADQPKHRFAARRLSPLRLVQIACTVAVAAVLAFVPLPTLADSDAISTATTDTPTQSTAQVQPAEAVTANEAPADSSQTTQTTDAATTAETPATSTAAPAESRGATNKDEAGKAPTVSNETQVRSQATTGDAVVKDNRDAGDATSGNADDRATVVNVANANGLTAGSFQTFNCDIRDDVAGNLVIDPATLLPSCTNTPAAGTPQQGSGQQLQGSAGLVEILNSIVLSAASGNATVSGNTTAGDATSGNAAALANVVNIANSAISAKNSFVGVLNIYGTVRGDILVPQSLVDGLAASGTVGSAASNQPSQIDNTVKASATSGDAGVNGNTTAGNAATGDAMTSVTIMNLTGQEVVAKNSLLVFVNVLGNWTGLIVPAPGSGKTALLGSGLQTSGTGQQTSGTGPSTGGARITNDISVTAASGTATVADNRTAGSATTGSAKAGVNLLNITNSNFRLDDWFGALFINVLGSWFGNFDIQKLAASSDNGTQPVQGVQVYQFAEAAAVSAPTITGPIPAPAAARADTAATATGSQAAASTIAPAVETGRVLGATAAAPASSSPERTGARLHPAALAALVITLAAGMGAAINGIRRRLAA